MDLEDEVAALNAEHRGRWHVARRQIRSPEALRRPCYVLDAAREPQRRYHVLDDDVEELRISLARIEREGSLIR
jgi:hypothetical protein